MPASRIAEENGILSSEGRPIGNVAVLGACVRQLVPGGLEFLEQAVASRTGATAGANSAAARAGYARCTKQHTLAGDVPVDTTPVPAPRRVRPPVFAVSTTDSRGEPHGDVVARPAADLARLHRLRRVRALLPGRGDHEGRRLDRRRLSLLQGLRDL